MVKEVYVVKMAKFRHTFTHLNDKIMKIQVEVTNEVMSAVMIGKYVEGSLRLQLAATGTHKEITFGAYNRISRKRKKARTIKQLEHGWVKETSQRIKVFNSLPKKIGAKCLVKVLERETKVAAEAIIDNEINNRV